MVSGSAVQRPNFFGIGPTERPLVDSRKPACFPIFFFFFFLGVGCVGSGSLGGTAAEYRRCQLRNPGRSIGQAALQRHRGVWHSFVISSNCSRQPWGANFRRRTLPCEGAIGKTLGLGKKGTLHVDSKRWHGEHTYPSHTRRVLRVACNAFYYFFSAAEMND